MGLIAVLPVNYSNKIAVAEWLGRVDWFMLCLAIVSNI
jgi:hypothetical protein